MDKEKENKKRQRALPTQMNLIIHIVAGGYLLYLAYSIYAEIGTAAGGQKIGLGLAILVFAVVGVTVVFSALQSLKRGEYKGGAGDPDREDEESETKKKKVESSAGKRIRFDEPEILPEESEEKEDKTI